jgi:hypothetical protein
VSARVRESQTRARRDGLVLGSPSSPLPCLPIPLDDVGRVNWLGPVCGYQSLVDEGGYLAAGDVAGGGKLFARGIVDHDFALWGGCYLVGGKTGSRCSQPQGPANRFKWSRLAAGCRIAPCLRVDVKCCHVFAQEISGDRAFVQFSLSVNLTPNLYSPLIAEII